MSGKKPSRPGPGVAVFTVQIQEIFEGIPGRKKYYTFSGGGFTAGLHAGATFRSDWKDFQIDTPATVDDFEGGGAIMTLPSVSIGVASLTAGIWIEFKNPPSTRTGFSALDIYPVKIYLNTTGLGRDSGFGAGIASFYFGWWEGRELIFH